MLLRPDAVAARAAAPVGVSRSVVRAGVDDGFGEAGALAAALRAPLLDHARKSARERHESPLSFGALVAAIEAAHGDGAALGDGTAASERATVIMAVRALATSDGGEDDAFGLAALRGPLAQPPQSAATRQPPY